MIESITLRSVASYSSETDTVIDTKKQIILIYGQNGTGKSTIGNYLQTPEQSEYISCSVQYSGEPPEVLVYNQRFIEKNFYETNQPGIFTLSEGNKEAELEIAKSEKEIYELNLKQELLIEEGKKLSANKEQEILALKDKVWEGKSKYDRTVLDFCLDGYKHSKDRFLDQVRSAQLVQHNHVTHEHLIKEASELKEQQETELPDVTQVAFTESSIENDPIFQEAIVGSKDSYLSQLIQKLGNADWVKNGREYLTIQKDSCPFCQQQLPSSFEDAITALFDKAYENKISLLKSLLSRYQAAINNLENKLQSPNFQMEYVTGNDAFNLSKFKLLENLKLNIASIQTKISLPSAPVSLINTNDDISTLNACISEVSNNIKAFNDRIRNKKQHLAKIKNDFWSMLKNSYSSVISVTDAKVAQLEDELTKKRNELIKIRSSIADQKKLIVENRAKITNIDLSIANINSAIDNLGLHGFRIEKAEQDSNYYKLTREGNSKHVYKTLSEGEKTLITFLYFVECCKGTTDKGAPAIGSNRVILIDDPVSSLSHNYVYDIASLIQHKIIEAGYRQVFVLTHSLFFFHELIKLKTYCQDKTLKKNYRFFRTTKNSVSLIKEMQESEVLNDYQSYWETLKDCLAGKVAGTVMPNMMRNILEYYFNFTHQEASLNAALMKLEKEEGEFKALFRYINRQSHSDGINIHDYGVINPELYMEKFHLIFKETGFEKHYQKMMGLEVAEVD